MRLPTRMYDYSIRFGIDGLHYDDLCQCEQCSPLYFSEGTFIPPLPIEDGQAFVTEQIKLRRDLLNRNIKHGPDGTLFILHHVFGPNGTTEAVWIRVEGRGRYKWFAAMVVKHYVSKGRMRFI